MRRGGGLETDLIIISRLRAMDKPDSVPIGKRVPGFQESVSQERNNGLAGIDTAASGQPR